MKRSKTICLHLGVFLILACTACFKSTLRVPAVEARPNVNLAKHDERLSLRIGPKVQDAYTLPRDNGIGPTQVSEWKASLRTGFKNAFSDSFVIADMEDGSSVLEIQEAELEIVPAAVAANGYVAAGRAQIRFKAQLRRGGKSVPLSGMAESKKAVTRMDGAPSAAKSAIETMYEGIADQLFNAKSSHGD